MTVPKQEIRDLDLASIRSEDRLRGIDEDAVAILTEAIQRFGFYTRVLVRQLKDGSYVLLDGAHRLEAMRRLDREKIPAVVLTCGDREAGYLESDANLARAELTPLDTAVFLAARRRLYQAMYPETQQGKAGAFARWEQAKFSSLASILAKSRGRSVRQVQSIMAAGDKLGAYEVAKLRQAPRPVTLADLQVIGKAKDPNKRAEVVAALSEGRAKSAAEAVAQLKGPKPARDPNSAAQEKIAAVWSRLPQAAKRAFAADHEAELRHLLAELEAE